MKKNKILLLIVAVIVIVIIYFAIPKKESFKESERSSLTSGIAPKDFHGIPPEGTGGDPDLNRMKNRWTAPSSVSSMTINEIIALPHDGLNAMDKEHRRSWSTEATRQAAMEDRGVEVAGYIARVKEEGPEACNGKSDIYHDFHIWLTESPGADKSSGIIVEAIPFWKEQFPGWTFNTLDKLAYEHAKVRVRGWLLWDEEHDNEVGKSRGSSWEVHPITNFEVYTGGQWRQLGRTDIQ